MRVEIGPLSEPDRHPAVDIFNHYVEHGFAAYPEARIPHQVFDALWKAAAGYPAVVARSETGEVVGALPEPEFVRALVEAVSPPAPQATAG